LKVFFLVHYWYAENGFQRPYRLALAGTLYGIRLNSAAASSRGGLGRRGDPQQHQRLDSGLLRFARNDALATAKDLTGFGIIPSHIGLA